MKLVEMTSPQVRDVADSAVAILPLAAIEQHGAHLAVSTDTALVTSIAESAEAALREQVVLCPTLPFGSSHHHLAFAGTLSLSPQLYVTVVVELVESLLQSGFRRIVLLNGHGGNITPVRLALGVLSHKYDDSLRPNIALVTYWELGGAAFAGEAPMESPALSHACEYETSMMLHLFPERVRMAYAIRGASAEPNDYIGWEDDQPYRGVSMSKRTHFISDAGSSGRPDLATAAKGEHLYKTAVGATIQFLQDYQNWPAMPDLHQR